MENARRKPLAAIWITSAMLAAATAAIAANLDQANGIAARYFGEAAVKSATVAPPAAAATTTSRKPQPQPQPPAGGGSGSGYQPGDPHPDWAFTPGRLCTANDPDFQEFRYAEHIPYCKRNVTQQMKQTVAAHYGVPESDWSNYEFDHLIPLAIGGDSHVDNLWPEPNSQNAGNGGKDHLELELYLQMKAGTITQAEAVRQIYGWFGQNYPAQAAQMAAMQAAQQ